MVSTHSNVNGENVDYRPRNVEYDVHNKIIATAISIINTWWYPTMGMNPANYISTLLGRVHDAV
jgi:hypothetical protein